MNGPDYFVVKPFVPTGNIDRSLDYVESIQESYVDFIEIDKTSTPGRTNITFKTDKIATLKHSSWQFQNEVRYILLIFPTINLHKIFGNVNDMNNHSLSTYLLRRIQFMVAMIEKGMPTHLDHFDLDLDPQAISEMDIILGPCATAGDEAVLEATLKAYGPGLSFQRSSLHGTIRLK